MISNFRTLAEVLVFLKCSFSDIKSSAGFLNVTPQTVCTGILYTMLVCDSIGGRNFGAGNCCCRVVNGLFTTVALCLLRTRVKGSVTPLMQGSEAKDLRDSVGSTILKNIPTSSSGYTFVVEDRVPFSLYVFDKLRWITVGLQSCMNIIKFPLFSFGGIG